MRVFRDIRTTLAEESERLLLRQAVEWNYDALVQEGLVDADRYLRMAELRSLLQSFTIGAIAIPREHVHVVVVSLRMWAYQEHGIDGEAEALAQRIGVAIKEASIAA
ncbi:hypothetical protein [Streptomyces sp. NPDC053048]|uniref:hypothetical protein n=1 Tax=Streptomyces sp. NPDC053048 TaxID=3365694 RepID=UPI0037D101FA